MKDWLEKLNDPTRDVYERRYRLHSLVSIVSLFLWLLVAVLVNGWAPRFAFFGLCELLFIPTMIVTLKTGNVQRGAGASGVFLVFLMLPFAIFYNGGIYAGAPNWCILSLVFVTLTVRGRLCRFLQISAIAVTVLCYLAVWLRPELVEEFTTASAYVDSLASLLITGAQVSVMFLFQLHMGRQERELLEAQQKEILELNRAQNRFFSSMSHEIRTPVNTIVGLNEMILREDVSPEVAEDAEQVRAAGKLLLHLINDILDLSRLESGQMELSAEPYGLGELLSELVGMLWLPAREKGLQLHLDVDPALPAKLVGDELRIRQILINVLNNAIKYTDHGSVSLRVEGRPGEGEDLTLVFTVTDTGQGIKKENLPYLFTAFKRVEDERNRKIEGTGLGLTIVKQLVDRMGGTISVNSVYMQGSTFTVELPQRAQGGEALGVWQPKARRVTGAANRYQPRFKAPEARVLVVDDSAANRMVVQKLLRDTGVQIDAAESGEAALQMTLRTQYHLIFMDHLMPGMDGVACLEGLRNQTGGMSKTARVVALTANADGDSRSFYAQKGFDGYLLKPCTGEELELECIRLLPPELVRLSRKSGEILEHSMSWMSPDARRDELAITTDSIADLPPALARSERIGLIPHTVQTADGSFRDGLEIEALGLVAYLEANRGSAVTVAPGVADYEAFFAEQLSRANHVLHVSISSKLAGSGCQNARAAAEAFSNVTVVDSGHLSSGEGLLALEAARLAREGLAPGEIAARLENGRELIHTSFIVDSLN